MKWEDWKHGLYNLSNQKQKNINKSFKLLSNNEMFYKYAATMVVQWPISSEENLTDTSRNRCAWIGQATCCWRHGANELETKMAWRMLEKELQNNANEIARKIIYEFEARSQEGGQLCLKLVWG